MTGLALGLAAVFALAAAAIRFGGAALVRSSRADVLHDAAEGDQRAARLASLLDDRVTLQASLGFVHASLLVAAAIPAAWAISAVVSGWALAGSLAGLGVLLVLGAESLPRTWGRGLPGRPAYPLSRLLEAAVRIGSRASDLILDIDEDDEEEEEDDSARYEEETEPIRTAASRSRDSG